MRNRPANRTVTGANGLWQNVLIFAGVGILLWSGLEDRDAAGATAFGVLSSVALTMGFLWSRLAGRANNILLAAFAGLMAGALSSVATAALMLFKDLRHAHPFPDFPPEMILGVLERLPYWAVAGALAGIGIGILRDLLAHRHRKCASD